MRYEKCLERLLKLTNMDMEKTNEIITIDGKLVRVAYTGTANHCKRCCIKGARCRVRLEPCQKYNDPNSPLSPIFVPAEEIEGTPQEVTLNPSNEDADKAAREFSDRQSLQWIRENPFTSQEVAFKAGIAYERERLMKEAPVAEVREMRGSTETGDPFILTLAFPRLPNIEYHGGKVRVIIEEIKD